MSEFRYYVYQEDCLEVLRRAPDNYFDSIVTDPPAGIEFMGREWDTFKDRPVNPSGAQTEAWHEGGRNPYARGATPRFTGKKGNRDLEARENFIGFMTAVMTECLRVLKPGAHALVWAIPRTSHWTATALEDAGFEVRDCLTHHYGSGFPKSRDIGKDVEGWDGWGTALKPATEHWILVRKPLSESSIAKNVLKWATGALNIDGCRVHRAADDVPGWHKTGAKGSDGYQGEDTFRIRDMSAEEIQERCGDKGRWPTNLLLTHAVDCDEDGCCEDCPVWELDQQSGITKGSGKVNVGAKPRQNVGFKLSASSADRSDKIMGYGDSGGASRFFPTFRYQAKPSRSERERGLDALPESTLNRVNPGGIEHDPRWAPVTVKNNHPTVKGVELMKWLCQLITPAGGLVLDPFCGSGSTGVACMGEGFRFVGIEQDEHYCQIAQARMEHAAQATIVKYLSPSDTELVE